MDGEVQVGSGVKAETADLGRLREAPDPRVELWAFRVSSPVQGGRAEVLGVKGAPGGSVFTWPQEATQVSVVGQGCSEPEA